MKQILFYILFVVLLVIQGTVSAQAPQKISYQAVVRDQNNNLVKDSPIGVQISIVKEFADGDIVYSETHNIYSNSNGLITLEIGTGAAELGSFETIQWANGPYFLKTEIDPSGGFSYSISGTNEMLSVPYALHAATADSIANLQILIDSVVQKYPGINITSTDIDNWNVNSVAVTGNETVFDGWDKNAEDDFSGNYNDLTNKPVNVSEFLNDAGYLTVETDYKYTQSAAARITASDVTDIKNLSGINTGDQDLSGLVSSAAFADSLLAVRSEIQVAAGGTEIDPVFTAWDKSTGIAISQSQITDLSVFEKELNTNENSVDVGFTLLSTSTIYLNGVALQSGQWSGLGTQTLNLNLEIELFDKLKVTR